MVSSSSSCAIVAARGALRYAAPAVSRALRAAEERYWCKSIVLVGGHPHGEARDAHGLENDVAGADELAALAARAARLDTPVVGWLEGQSALSVTSLATIGGVGFCVATESAALSVRAPHHGVPLAAGESAALSRLPGALGAYLALTGCTLGPHELVHSGIVREYIHSSQFERVTRTLDDEKSLTAGTEADEPGAPRALVRKQRARTLETRVGLYGMAHEMRMPSALDRTLASIHDVFSAPTAAEIVERLAADHSEWAGRALAAMRAASPRGLACALAQLRAAKRAPSLGACLDHERQTMAHFLDHVDDAAECVRALEVASASPSDIPPWAAPYGAFATLDAPGAAGDTPGAPASELTSRLEEAERALAAWPALR